MSTVLPLPAVAEPGLLGRLLALPQSLHYVLDGFSWRRDKATVAAG